MSKERTGRPSIVVFVAVMALGLGSLVFWLVQAFSAPSTVQVTVPELSDLAQSGEKIFSANCALCHGENASGTDQGPPLVHDIYNPGHHGDQSFRNAPKRGVPAHHWPYGDMPPMPEITGADMTAIIAYVRELQRANGIVSRPHRMNMSPGMKK